MRAAPLCASSAEELFCIWGSEKPAGFSEPLFHGWGRRDKRQVSACFLRKQSRCRGQTLSVTPYGVPAPPKGGASPLRRSRARFPLLSPAVTSSPGAGEVFPQRESQVLRLVTKVLGSIRKFPAVLLPLPLGEVDLRSKDGEGEDAAHIKEKRARNAAGVSGSLINIISAGYRY